MWELKEAWGGDLRKLQGVERGLDQGEQDQRSVQRIDLEHAFLRAVIAVFAAAAAAAVTAASLEAEGAEEGACGVGKKARGRCKLSSLNTCTRAGRARVISLSESRKPERCVSRFLFLNISSGESWLTDWQPG